MMHGGNVWQGDDPGAWLDFSANLRPEGMPEWVKRTIAKASENARYYPEITMRDARKGLAAYAGVTEDEILPTPGGMAAIDAVLSVGRGKVLIDRCTFGEYAARAAAHGRPCTAADEKTPLNEGTRVLCNPNNPTGEAHSREEVLAMHKALSDCGGELVVDEAFIDFCPEFSVRRDVRAGLTVVGSLTKILCIPGVRLGYVCGSKELIARLSENALPWQLNAFAAAIAAEVPHHLEEMRFDARINAGRRAEMKLLLESLGAKVLPSQANFLLCDFGRDMNNAAHCLRQKRISVRQCASFGLGSGFLRLAVRTEEENRLLIKELQTCLKS